MLGYISPSCCSARRLWKLCCTGVLRGRCPWRAPRTCALPTASFHHNQLASGGRIAVDTRLLCTELCSTRSTTVVLRRLSATVNFGLRGPLSSRTKHIFRSVPYSHDWPHKRSRRTSGFRRKEREGLRGNLRTAGAIPRERNEGSDLWAVLMSKTREGRVTAARSVGRWHVEDEDPLRREELRRSDLGHKPEAVALRASN